MPHPLAPYVVAGALAAAPAPVAFYADGFAGAWTRSVLVDAADAVQGCRAAARLDDIRAVKLERRRGWPETLLVVESDHRYDLVAMIPATVIADGVRLPASARIDGPAVTLAIGDEAMAALAAAKGAGLDVDGVALTLPAEGLGRAAAYVARCG